MKSFIRNTKQNCLFLYNFNVLSKKETEQRSQIEKGTLKLLEANSNYKKKQIITDINTLQRHSAAFYAKYFASKTMKH